jgi:hypothetical protein
MSCRDDAIDMTNLSACRGAHPKVSDVGFDYAALPSRARHILDFWDARDGEVVQHFSRKKNVLQKKS